MSQTFTINGVGYSYPDQGDQNWGSNATNWASAVTTGMLQKAGGTFTLTADVNFGASFGLKSQYFVSRGTNAATAGVIRLAKTEGIEWRNNANGGNNVLTTDTSDQLLYNGVVIANVAGILPTTSGGTGLASYTAGDMVYYASGTAFTKLAIGTVSKALVSTGTAPSWALLVNANIDAAAAIAYSKLALTGSIVNADISASAAIAYSKLALTGSIVNADVSTSAAIAFSKLASLTSAHILVGSAGNVATDVAVSGDISITNAGVTAYAGVVGVSKGGTGQSSNWTANGVIYASSTTVLSSAAAGTSGYVLTSNGSGSAPTMQSLQGNATALKIPTIQTLTSASGTYTTPSSPSPLYIRVRMVGGGGGGGGGGATGGSGEAGAGGNTTFGSSLLTANGGAATTSSGGVAGAGGSATVNSPALGQGIQGGTGGGSSITGNNASSTRPAGGSGAASPFGGQGGGGSDVAGDVGGAAIARSGSGGGGATAAVSGGGASATGGAGGAAGGYINAIITGPSASYAYAVGAAGTAGAAGTNGFAGGIGGSGIIIVEEFYQ